MKICVFYTSPKLGDIILQLPFIKAISDHYKTKVIVCVNKHVNIKDILVKQEYVSLVIENPFRKVVKILEIQKGSILKETDIVRYKDIYGRIN
mgnify:CR=1 FL=1